MSLLLKALKQSDTRFAPKPAPTVARSRTPVVSRMPTIPPPDWEDASAQSLIACEAADRRDPIVNSLFADHTAAIELFEPIAETASSFLPAEAWEAIDEPREEFEEESQPYTPDVEATAQVAPAAGAPEVGECEVGTSAARSSESSAAFASVLGRLDQLQHLVARGREDRDEPSADVRTSPTRATRQHDAQIRDEYRELRDHLLTRMAPAATSTLLCIDAGRQSIHPGWLIPLAASFCQTFRGQHTEPSRVLIVDLGGCDVSLARYLGLDDRDGFIQALKRDTPLDSVIMSTEHSGIDLMTCHAAELNGVSLKSMEAVWSELTERYRLIFISAGSIFVPSSQVWTSTQPFEHFLPLVDGVVLSVELNGTPKPVAEATRRRLSNFGVELLGSVVHGDAE